MRRHFVRGGATSLHVQLLYLTLTYSYHQSISLVPCYPVDGHHQPRPLLSKKSWEKSAFTGDESHLRCASVGLTLGVNVSCGKRIEIRRDRQVQPTDSSQPSQNAVNQ
ncbi:hypothetical protein GGR56DRAFT_648706 [Xylariaceae sp. FL0804]|nr:hypothetical protein GGR56DRAFT_648706 [Xylariaceae sp. FL0804]